MAKKITFNPISNNFDYVNDTTKLEYDLSKKQSKDFDSVNGNLAIFDNNGQTADSGKTIGKETITKNIYYVLRNINDDTQNVYCSEEPFSLRVGSVIYVDKECTTEYGKVSYYMSGTIRIDTDTSIFWAIDYEPKEFVSTKRVATESAVVNFLKKSDWNQNDETATDYIKNRTHYEAIAEHVEMSDNEYNEKKANGSTFVLTKVATEVINSNEYSSAKGVEVGNKNDFDKIYNNILRDASDTYTHEGNKTKICYRIAINGIDVDLQWHKTDVYGGNEEISPDGTYEVFYGFAPSDNWMAAHHVVGNGIVVKNASCVKGYYGGNAHYFSRAFLIDKSIYGEAPYTIDFYFECEQTIKKLDKKFLPDGIVVHDEVFLWDENSDINNYTETGIYHFKGFRTNENDNLPIGNVGEFVNIAFTLIVDKVEGKYDTTAGINLPEHVSQTLFLGNRQGSETKIYVRNATTFLSDGTTTWESWKELVTSTYLGIASSMEDELLNNATEIGLYTGAIVNTSTNTFDVFKLEVINNYAISNQASQLTGSTIPNTVLQTMTIVSLDGTDKQYKRKGNSINDVYQWGEWEEASATTKYKTGDVVILEHITESDIQTKVISWENFIENKDSYKYVDIYSKGAYPIGIIVDPQKKTFIYLRTKVIANAPAVSSSEDVFCDLLFNSLHDGLGNTKSLMRQRYIDKNIIGVLSSTVSIFYNGSNNQLTQFIPSRDENVLLKNVFYDNDKGWQNFRDRIEELNAMMGDEDNYPTTYHQGINAFYTYTSSLVKTTDSLSSVVSYTFYTATNQLDVSLFGQGSKTDRIVYGILMNDEE